MKQKNDSHSRRGRICWCGEKNLHPFSATYQLCPNCATLVLKEWPDESTFKVEDDESAFYGKHYFTSHVVESYGQMSLDERARVDLSQRCLHWLKTLLKYKSPPASILELGSGHGGFVALCKWAGFNAIGLEISPWVAEYAKKSFEVPMLTGPIENQNIPPASLDVIALMDVIEHLPDPVSTLGTCLSLLKDEGILLIQTPRYTEGTTHEQFIARNDRFLEHFKEKEHLYLFSEGSARLFFKRLGPQKVIFERAYFDFYDMFFVVHKSNTSTVQNPDIWMKLSETPSGKMISALLNLEGEREDLEQRLRIAEVDRAARLDVIEEQGRRSGEIEAERNRLRFQLEDKQRQFIEIENDRKERLLVIEEQGRRLGELDGERNRLNSLLSELASQFRLSEDDRADRLRVIEHQGQKLSELDRECNKMRSLAKTLQEHYDRSEEDRAARLRVIEEQGHRLGELVGERDRLIAALAAMQVHFNQSEEDRAARLRVIEEQGKSLGALESEIDLTREALKKLQAVHHDQSRLVQGLNEQLPLLKNQLNIVQSALNITLTSLPVRLFGRFGVRQKVMKAIENGFGETAKVNLDVTENKRHGKD